MSQQPEPGDVCNTMHTGPAQGGQRLAIGLLHAGQGRSEPAPLATSRHMRRENGACPNGFGEHQSVIHREFVFRPALVFSHRSCDGDSHGQFHALAAVATDQGAAGPMECPQRTGHELVKIVLHEMFSGIGYGGPCQRSTHDSTHGEHIVHGVFRGNSAQQIWVVQHGAEAIQGLQLQLIGHRTQYRRIITNTLDGIWMGVDLQARQHPVQHVLTQFGSAPSTTHLVVGLGNNRICYLFLGPGLGHVVIFESKPGHKAAVNPVFAAPYPRATRGKSAPRGHSALVAGGNQRQKSSLGSISLQRPGTQSANEIVSQHRSLAHGINAGFSQFVSIQAGDIARSKHRGMGNTLQTGVGPDKT